MAVAILERSDLVCDKPTKTALAAVSKVDVCFLASLTAKLEYVGRAL